jgi:poly-gamma-glutamate capsule biosynthesis protein CapA/YwtB (metallophosphatase superfamily)
MRRIKHSVSLGALAAFLWILPPASVLAEDGRLVLIVGGDVEWSLNSRPPTVRYQVVDPKPYGLPVFGKRDVRDQVTGDWPPVPYVNEGESKTHLEGLGLKGPKDGSSAQELSYPLPQQARPEYARDYSSNESLLNYPLRRLAPTLSAADLVFVNCEGVLSDHGRQVGLNRTPEKFAAVMKSSGIGIVNLANNHTFDAEERGFLDTIRALDAAGISHVGGGRDLAEARTPVIVERNGIKIGFIGYTQFTNFGESAFAAASRSGVAPMDPFLIKDDIRRLRPQVDYVLVAIHWSTNRKYDISPDNRQFARDLIDAGADVILGHHPPHPKGIEVYHGKAILYAPSNILRGHTDPDSDDGYLVRFTLGKRIEKLEVLPIAGKGQPEGHTGSYDATLFQPFQMQGASARGLLEDVRSRSAALDTSMQIDGDVGVIAIPAASK